MNCLGWLLLTTFAIIFSCFCDALASTACPELACDLHCQNGHEEDTNGCLICRCRQCAPIVCRMYCHYGYEKDSDGCDICQCVDRPTTTLPQCLPKKCDYPCDNGYQLDDNGCKTCVCKDCPPVMCAMYCENGFVRDENGCEICKCKEQSDCPQPADMSFSCNLKCDKGYEKDNDGCTVCKCKDNSCSSTGCQLKCPDGFETDTNDCPRCKCLNPRLSSHCDISCPFGFHEKREGCGWGCKETVCESVICNKDELCSPSNEDSCGLNGNCSACLPFSGTQCRTIKDSGNCSSSFQRWFHDSASGTCFPFTYSGCAGNANNFNSKSECELACVEMPQPQILRVSFIMFRSSVHERLTEEDLSQVMSSLHLNLSDWMNTIPDLIENFKIRQLEINQDSKPAIEVSFDVRNELKNPAKQPVIFLGDRMRNRLMRAPLGPSSYLVADYNSLQLRFEPKASHNSVTFIVCFVAGALFILSLAVAVIVCSRRRKEFTLHELT